MFRQDKNFNNCKIAVINVCPVKTSVKFFLQFTKFEDQNAVII